MTPERRRQIDDLFNAAKEGGPDALAGADPELRREVETLLNTGSTAFLSTSARPDTRGLHEGAMLGPYRIEGRLGAGGMGEVWKARDVRVSRYVAIKTSRSEFNDRFKREATAVAALNHPHIAALFDVGAGESGFAFLVLEYVDGNTLADMISRGPLPHDQVLRIALEIAEAVEAAHDRGIIHRDLKPANIKLTKDGSVKVLDFGLAKTLGTEGGEWASEPDVTSDTKTGMVVGTPAYMSPEQASGMPVDRRADIWSFGVIVYEMLTGKRPFAGKGTSETLAAVLNSDVQLDDVPIQWRRLLQRCLTRAPRQRLQAIGEARIALEQGLPAATPSRDARSSIWPIIAAAALLAVVTLAGWILLDEPDHEVRIFDAGLGPQAIYGAFSTLAASADGSRIVFPVTSNGKQMLATRLLSEREFTKLQKTENGHDPFFSPKGDWIGFFADGKLRKIPVQGGAFVDLADAPNGLGASWGSDGTIVASLNGDALSRIPENGDSVAQFITALTDDLTHRWPQVLPDSGDVIFTAATAGMVKKRVMFLSAKTRIAKVLVEDAYFGRVLPSGELLYIQDGALWGAPFDRERARLGNSVKVLEDIVTDPDALAGYFDFSATGLFFFRPGAARNTEYPVKWLNKAGKTSDMVSRPDGYLFPRFSPRGDRILLNGGEGPYIYDTARGSLLARIQDARAAAWIGPEGKHLIVRRSITGEDRSVMIFTRDDGTGDQQVLYEGKGNIRISDVSLDGTWILWGVTRNTTREDIFSQHLDMTDPDHPKPGKAAALLNSSSNERGAKLSPDNRWLAYISDESGSARVYVRSFPDLGSMVEVSGDVRFGSTTLAWSQKRNELFFYDANGHIFVVEYSVQGTKFDAKPPRLWSPTPIRLLSADSMNLHPDGDRFVVFPQAPPSTDSGVRMTVVINGVDEIRRRIQAAKN